jgi:hypothetical protein
MNRRSVFMLYATMGSGLAATVLFDISSGAARAQTAEQLVGTWQLVSSLNIAADGKKIDAFGPNPVGMVIFTAGGHFMLMNSRRDLPRFASNNRMQGTSEENKAVVQGSTVLFGTYSLHDSVITMKIDGATYPNFDGAQQIRNIIAFDGTEMKWTVQGTALGGHNENTWNRLE